MIVSFCMLAVLALSVWGLSLLTDYSSVTPLVSEQQRVMVGFSCSLLSCLAALSFWGLMVALWSLFDPADSVFWNKTGKWVICRYCHDAAILGSSKTVLGRLPGGWSWTESVDSRAVFSCGKRPCRKKLKLLKYSMQDDKTLKSAGGQI